MNNFLRAIRLCLANRVTVIGALTCSVLVGALWGANIAPVLPLIRVLFHGESVIDSYDQDIATGRAKITELDQQLTSLPASTAGQRQETAAERVHLQDRRQAEVLALEARERFRPLLAKYLPADKYQLLLAVVIALIFTALLRSAFLMGNAMLVERAIRRAMLGVRKDFFSRALEMDISQLGETNTGAMTSQFTYDMNTLVLALRNLFGKATVEPLKILACLTGAAIISWRLLLISLILAPLAGFAIRKLASAIKRSNRRAMEEMSQLVGRLSESLESVQVVKAFTMERQESQRFDKQSATFYRKAMRIVWFGSLVKPSIELTGILITCAALLGGGYLVLEQQTHLFGLRITERPLSPEMMFAFFAMLVGMSDPARKMANIYNVIQPGVPAADRIFAMLDRSPTIQDPARPKTVARPHRVLSFENIAFSYGDGTQVLQNIRLKIPHGETLAIVGPNGCGKSTLANLIPRFYDPTAGSVRIDGVDLRDMTLTDVRNRIALVSQQAMLFDDTIANNIRYGSLDATDEQVQQAARRADAHTFITRQCEAGYETVVGPRGERLSGGQRQKIALARAILRDPDILILDEATSQVDLESEHQVHQVLEQFVVGRTSIIITHRLSTLRLASRILVMQAGGIGDIGTHEQLLSRCPLYQRLHAGELKKSA